MRKAATVLLICSLLAIACWLTSFRDNSPVTAVPIDFSVPKGFPQPVYDFKKNPITVQGFALGRKLFYDGQLSKDGNFACASCHQQFAAFATYDHDLSHGFDNQFTIRNAPPLFNLAWQQNFHWDGGVNNLDVQALAPLTAPNEMAEDLKTVIAKLSKDPSYPPMFKAAFGTPVINSQRLLFALSQFTVSMVSATAKYDRVMQGVDTFNKYEATGYAIFKEKCSSCHREPLFTDQSFRNTGLAANPTLKDVGRMRITGDRNDSLKFRVPSLRNAVLTFPYGHDGRFYSLYQAIEHYNSGIQSCNTLDSSLRKRISISENEKYYLSQFLRTLTDSAFLKDKRFAQP
jgi:cytochrome c peroxidase